MRLSRVKGQFLIVSLIATLMTLLAFAAMYPIMKSFINDTVDGCTTYMNSTRVCTGEPMDVYSGTMLQMSPFFIVIAIILSIVFASLPMREG